MTVWKPNVTLLCTLQFKVSRFKLTVWDSVCCKIYSFVLKTINEITGAIVSSKKKRGNKKDKINQCFCNPKPNLTTIKISFCIESYYQLIKSHNNLFNCFLCTCALQTQNLNCFLDFVHYRFNYISTLIY